MEERIEIGCYTNMSKREGISSVSKYLEEAIKRNCKAIGISDYNSVQSFLEAEKYIEKNKIKDLKILYGLKTKFVKDDNFDKSYDIAILVKEQKGLKNLYTLLSKAFTNQLQEEPTLLKSQLDQYREGLLYGSYGKNGEIYKYFNENNIDEKLKYYDFLAIEQLSQNATKIEKEKEQKIVKLGYKNNILVVATSSPLFVQKEEKLCNDIVKYSQRLNVEYFEKVQEKNNDSEKYFKNTQEMLEAFSYIENEKTRYEIVVENAKKLANMCENINVKVQKAKYPVSKEQEEIIKKKCYEKAKELYGEKIPKEVEERLELELNSIIKNKFEWLYLLIAELVLKSQEMGYISFPRGGIGNSFVSYLLGITDYNPIDYHLPFELFAGIELNKEPDISINVSPKIRESLFEYVIEKYGKDKVIFCGTVETIGVITASNMVKKYEEDFETKIIPEKRDRLIEQISEIKRETGIHPGGICILSKEQDINDFCPIEIDEETNRQKTHQDYHKIAYETGGLLKFNILEHDEPTILHKLQEATKVDLKTIDLEDKETIELFLRAGDKTYNNSTKGISEFETKFMIEMLKEIKAKDLNDLVCASCLAHGSNTWLYNGENLIKKNNIPVSKLISNRADIMNYLMENGIERKIAYQITEFIRKGKAAKARDIFDLKSNRETYFEEWHQYKKILEEHNIPEWYIDSAEKVSYLFPKSHAIGYAKNAFYFAWFKVHYPKEFYQVYFETQSTIDVSKYVTKSQIEKKLKRYEKEELNTNQQDEVNTLQMLLEMYNRGIKKEEDRALDEYDLINSTAISDYCREIGHKFNTEELAVLVYRNKRMSVDEKISKYQELINNYPDMEVIERINCKHYDSVKDLIKSEITRLQTLKEKLEKEESDVIYTYTELNKSTNEWENRNELRNARKTFKIIEKELEDYINEYDDTYSYEITKTYLNDNNSEITGEYHVFNKKGVLVNIKDSKNNWLDIDGIFLNIPTPFKKGDILVSWSRTPYREENSPAKTQILVLEWLCTWREDLKERLEKGGYDSSDMIGNGYCMQEEYDYKIMYDNMWDYDSFEYFEGELTGASRILKAISSLMQEKIGIEVFIDAYEEYKREHEYHLSDCYSEKTLKLAGYNEENIKNIHH